MLFRQLVSLRPQTLRMEVMGMFTDVLPSFPSNINACSRRESIDPKRLAYNACKEYLPGPWARLSSEEFQCTELGGGLTNRLYTCTLPSIYRNNESEYPTVVLFRLYGLIMQNYKAQMEESVVFSILAERGIGPKLHAVFPGGRLEQFIPECRTLLTKDLYEPHISKHIAERVADYHSLVMPVKKEPTCMMSKLLKYFEVVQTTKFQDPSEQQLLEEFFTYNIAREIAYITEMIEKMNPVVVYCHNDLQEGNLLYSNDEERANRVQLIDFEYSCYNYRGFDIANHFCEWTYDYVSATEWPNFSHFPHRFPKREEQIHFIKAYLNTINSNCGQSKRDDPKWQMEYVLDEANRLVLMSHLFWALWSVRQAQISDISFGYLEYALARMGDYMRHKHTLEDER